MIKGNPGNDDNLLDDNLDFDDNLDCNEDEN